MMFKDISKSQEGVLRNELFVSLKNNRVAEVLFSIDYNLKKNEKSKKVTNNLQLRNNLNKNFINQKMKIILEDFLNKTKKKRRKRLVCTVGETNASE